MLSKGEIPLLEAEPKRRKNYPRANLSSLYLFDDSVFPIIEFFLVVNEEC